MRRSRGGVLSPKEDPLTFGRIFWFWLPLAAVWLMMGIEPPVVAAGVARLADPKVNLAAFGVSFAMALVLESPVIQLLGAATALVQNGHARNQDHGCRDGFFPL